ncbi:hypothetical protein LOCC1_G006995 [Lachnellula occidentalis]|uniref:Aminoglycoside phosphotransferase domain-containing protein n=1 Tax=Lachnellula occidentalis TaxID=215460 RepID=A0A8H8RXP1_9HELO|nr:hypothetical protein LOCC1_G006995 [Lachnellula occidentalis]
MKLSKLMPWREGNPSETPLSETPKAKTPQELADLDYANLRPSDLPYPVPYYAGATIDLPRSSSLYRAKSWRTFHLRASAYASAYIAGMFHYSPTPMIPRKTILIRAPFPMVMKYGTDIQLPKRPPFHRGMQFILMEFVRGKRLADVWGKTTPAGREILLKQLEEHFTELRNIPHPRPEAICSVDIGPLFDRRIDRHGRGFGPFATEKDFNNFLRCGVTDTNQLIPVAGRFGNEEAREEVSTMIAIQDRGNHKICFTHGDAHSRNFLVKGQNIVAWIDFEMGGFYPEHWEYTTAMTTGNDEFYDDSWWKQELKKILKEYPEELQGEVVRQDRLDWRVREVLPRGLDFPE